jgi:hypothetical protein
MYFKLNYDNFSFFHALNVAQFKALQLTTEEEFSLKKLPVLNHN